MRATKTIYLTLLFIAFLSLSSTAVLAEKFDPALTWKSYETEHFIFHYDVELRHLVSSLSPKAEKIHESLSKRFEWLPSDKTHVVITDKTDFTNGAATILFANHMFLYASPPFEPLGLEDFDDWLELIFIHEYTHILHLDMTRGLPKHLRWVFGRHFLLFPNVFMPRWLVEGIATYIETNTDSPSGRGESSYFKALMRMEIERGFMSAGNTSQVMESWPGLTRWYLYGVYWFKFLEEKYGKDKILDLLQRQSGFPIPYLPDVGAWLALDKTIVGLWSEYEAYIEEQFGADINQLENEEWQTGNNISNTGYLNRNPQFISDNTFLYVANDGKNSSWLTQYDITTNQKRKISRVYGGRFDVHPDNGVLIAQTEIHRNVNLHTDLYIIDLDTGKQRRLSEAQRYLFGSWAESGDRIAAVKLKQARHHLHILNNDGQLIEEISLPDQSILNSVDWSSNDRRLLVSMWKPDHRWHLEEYDFATQTWKALSRNSDFEFYARYIDNDAIVYSADYGDVYNIYRLSDTNAPPEKLTSVKGAAYFADIRNDKLVYSGLNPLGFDIYLANIKDKKTAPTATQAKPTLNEKSSNKNANELEETEYSYHAIKHIRPRWWLPTYVRTPDQHELGITTAAFDFLSWHTYSFSFAYELDIEKPVGSFSYIYDRWLPSLSVSASRQYIVDTTSFDALDINLSFPWRKRDAKWLGYTGVSYQMLPNITYDLYGVGLNFSNLERNAYSVTAHNGVFANAKLERLYEWPLDNPAYNANLRLSGITPLLFGTTFNIRSFTGVSSSTLLPYLLYGRNRYEVGGSVTDFGRRGITLRGYSGDDLTRRFGNLVQYFGIDWNFPLARIENGFVFPPVGLIRMQGNLFAEMGRAWNIEFDANSNLLDVGESILDLNSKAPGFSRSVGAEITFLTSVWYTATCEYALGIAAGLDQGGEIQQYMYFGCPL